MSFFTYNNNVENITSSSNSLTPLFSILGVIVGFLLTYISARKLRKNEIEKVGDSFESNIRDLKIQLHRQYQNTLQYEEIVKKKEVGVFNISFMYEINHFQNIDRLKLFDFYYGKHKEKKTKDEINRIISKTISDVSLLYIEIKRLVDANENFINQIESNTLKYVMAFNKLGRSVLNYSLKIGMANIENDKYLQYLRNLMKTTKGDDGLSTEKIITLNETLHNNLFNSEHFNANHPLFQNISEFDAEGTNIINEMNYLYTKNADFIDVIKTAIASGYNALYQKSILEKID